MTAGGLAFFLVAARPTAGGDVLTLDDVIPLAFALFVLMVASCALAVRATGIARALALALGAGILYGVTAAVAKVTIGQFSGGLLGVLTHWSLWTVVILGPLGFYFNQLAFRESELVSPVVAVITVTDPLVGIGIGILWLHESLRADAGAVLGEVFGLLMLAGGVWLVAHRAPHLATRAASDPAGAGTTPEHTGDGGGRMRRLPADPAGPLS
jgi:hypothetical protein